MIDAPTAFATPDQTFTDSARRSITYRWMRPDVTPWDDGGTRAVEMYVRHDRDSKRITAALNLIDVHAGYVSTHIARGHYLTLVSDPCPRYSAKALQTTAAAALTTLNLGQQDARVIALMAGEPFDC
jgi:hypothetical protein